MSWGYTGVAAATLVAGWMSSEAQKEAGRNASGSQKDAARMSIAEQRRQFDAIQKLLAPYIKAGETALSTQMALSGLSGEEAQQEQISLIENSPIFSSLVEQGEDAILANASATGEVRGGDIKGVLAQFRPQMLKAEIEGKYNKLSGITNLGQSSATGVGAAGSNSANNISNLMSQFGEAEAQRALLEGKANAGLWGDVGSAIGIGASLYSRNNRGNRNVDPYTGKPRASTF